MKAFIKKIAAFTAIALSTVSFSSAAAEVEYLASGKWQGELEIYGNGFATTEQNIWIDMKVSKDLQYGKSVYIVWTDNNWESTYESVASYEHGLEGNYEQWGIDVAPIGILDQRRYGQYWLHTFDGDSETACPQQQCQVVIEYAIKAVAADGTEYWDNNGGQNYTITFNY